MNNKWKQQLHLEPPKGWLNDPNGLCWFNGKYHVYFQYAPDDIKGGVKKCWGHYESEDMLSWNFTGIVLYPDTPYDASGAYSGCAVVNGDELDIFYTGNVKHPGDYDYVYNGREANVIKVTTRDGHNMTPKQVLLRNSDYPDFCCCHVRDPKVWREDGRYYMILGARTLDSEGCVLIYESEDLNEWRYKQCIGIANFGYMWECPDCFKLDNQTYISVSPQGLPHGETENQNMFSSGYFKYDGELIDFIEWDYGFDFYAPQTFDAPDGRKILIGWMGMCDAYGNPTAELGRQHCLTLPRELTRSSDGAILQNPIREIETLRRQFGHIGSGENMILPLPVEMCATVNGNFTIKLDSILMKYDGEIFSIEFDGNSGFGRDIRRVKTGVCRDIRIIADRSGIEIYLNGGRYVMSTRFYPDSDAVKCTVDGIDAELYKLEGMEMKIYGK